MNTRIFPFLLCLLLALTGCYEDESNDRLLPKATVRVTGIAESYTVGALKEVSLDITPDVVSPGNEHRAWWGIVSEKDRYNAVIDTLARTVELHIRRSFLPGEYILLYYVEDVSTGLSHMLKTRLSARTEFSKGWWVQKTTPDGTGCDIDMFPDEGSLIPDVIRNAAGQPLEGKAVDMTTAQYSFSYTTTDASGTPAREQAAPLIVASARELAVLNLETGIPVARMADLFVEQPATPDITALCHAYGHLYLGCNGQIHAMGYSNGSLVGMFNTPLLGDTPLPYLHSGQPRTKALCFDDVRGAFFTLPEDAIRVQYMEDEAGAKLTGLDAEVLAAGPHDIESNFDDATSEVVLRDRTTGRVSIYTFQSNLNNKNGNVKSVRQVVEGRLLHRAEHVCVAKEYRELFFTVGRDLYMYDIATGSETLQLTLPGTDAVTLLQCVRIGDFEPEPLLHLLLGTSDGNRYTLRVYSFRAGHITEPAVRTLEGEGTVRRAVYAANVDGYIHRTCLE